MVMNKFVYEFEQDAANQITFEYSPEADERLDAVSEKEGVTLFLNRPGMLTLARILIKMARGDYAQGFHVHFHKDFNADFPETLTVVLSPDDAPPY